MPRYFLSQISIEGFRGINNEGDPLVIKFKPGSVNSVHAHNGVGKTSIFEALHFAIFGTVPRLTRLQAAEHPEDYIGNRFHSAGGATIGLTFVPDDGSQDITISISRDALGRRTTVGTPSATNPERFLEQLRQDFVLVDYAKFSQFLDASALERGRSFASLVGLSRYSQFRQALERAADTRSLNNDFNVRSLQSEETATVREATAASAAALTAYREITSEQITELVDIEALSLKVIEALRSIQLLAPLAEDKSLDAFDVAEAEALIEKTEGGPLRGRHAQVTKEVEGLQGLGSEIDEAQEQKRTLEIAKERDDAMAKVGGSLLRQLYHSAMAVANSPEWPDRTLCPVCGTKLDHPVTTRLEERIAEYSLADTGNESLKEAVLSATWVDRLEAIESSAFGIESGPTRLASSVKQEARDHLLPTTTIEKAIQRLNDLENKRRAALTATTAQLAEVEQQIPPSLVAVSRLLAGVRRFKESIGVHKKAETRRALIHKELELAERWFRFIADACAAFSAAETQIANDRITSIETEYQSLFSELVRGGPDLKPTLQRAPGTENVMLNLENFYGQGNVNARAVLSESYRNAVAASVFLAAAMRYNGLPRFVVLDDVTSSFDAGHQFSLMEAIRTRLQQPAAANGLQFIIFSHDTALEKYFDKQSGSTGWHHQKLQGMPPVGRVMISAQEADRLKKQAETFLNAGQVDLGAPFVRQYLEYKLSTIITKLQIPCPPDYTTRGDQRTLSTYLNAIIDAIDLYQDAGRCVLSVTQVNDVRSSHVPFIVSNFVNHYETGAGTPYGAYALLGVLQRIDDLADCFTWIDSQRTPPQKRFYRSLQSKA